MNANNVTVTVYSSGTTEIADYPRITDRISNLRFATGYPGGIYLDCTFYIPRDLADWWALAGAQRVVVRNGVGMVIYEGYIDSLDYLATEEAQGVLVTCIGAWGKILMRRRIHKLWSDTRTDENTWAWNNSQSLELWQVDRSDRIRIAAKGGCSYTTASADDAEIVYTAPTGQTIARMTYSFSFNEYAGRAFTMCVQEWTGAAWGTIVASVCATSDSGNADLTCSANTTKLRLKYYSNSDNATVVADEKNYASWSNICVYSETGTIDLPAVVTDVRGAISEINATDYYVTALGSARSLCGSADAPSSFGAFDMEPLSDVLIRAASFGDGSNNRWAVGFRHSELAPSQDGKPVIFCEQYPALTDYDFSVRLSDKNLSGSIDIKQNFGGIYNYVTIRYTDDNGLLVYVTPEDDANLKDATSITKYGQRDYLLDVGNASALLAKSNGYRFLAAYKDPLFELPSPITVRGTIRTKSKLWGPVSQVRAGQRIRVEDFLTDLTGTGTGATFLISATDYDDDTETITITAGPPDGLIFPVYQRWRMPDIWEGDNLGGREAIAAPETPPERITPDDIAAASSGGGGQERIKKTIIGLNKKGKPGKSNG